MASSGPEEWTQEEFTAEILRRRDQKIGQEAVQALREKMRRQAEKTQREAEKLRREAFRGAFFEGGFEAGGGGFNAGGPIGGDPFRSVFDDIHSDFHFSDSDYQRGRGFGGWEDVIREAARKAREREERFSRKARRPHYGSVDSPPLRLNALFGGYEADTLDQLKRSVLVKHPPLRAPDLDIKFTKIQTVAAGAIWRIQHRRGGKAIDVLVKEKTA